MPKQYDSLLSQFLGVSIVGGILSLVFIFAIVSVPFFLIGFIAYLIIMTIEKLSGVKNE